MPVTLCIILIGALAGAGIVAWTAEHIERKRHPERRKVGKAAQPRSMAEENMSAYTPEAWENAKRRTAERVESGECCGAHAVCEKESLIVHSLKAEYYEDEELDDYKGREETDYTEAEIGDFEEVLYTLREEEVAGWLCALQTRGVKPPKRIKEEALFVVAERRNKA